MKYSTHLLATATIFTVMAFGSCTSTGNTEAGTEQTGPEYTSAYVCPMHCEGSGSEEPGTCPVCQMDYVLNDKDQ